jgi:UDP-N-acetyl-D-glucosamine dehydrogenase
MKVAIVGLGYVGLPLAVQFAHTEATVVGLDVNEAKVDLLNRGQSYIKHIKPQAIQTALKDERFRASTDFRQITNVEAVIICVPTPITKNREPDISFVLETGRTIAPYLSKGALVSWNRQPTQERPRTNSASVLEEESGMKTGVDFHLAFSPEREDPGNTRAK